MPTIYRARGYREYFYSRENAEPPHVHVDKAGATAKVWLEPVAVASHAGFAGRGLSDVLALVRANQRLFLEAWHGFFGSGQGG